VQVLAEAAEVSAPVKSGQKAEPSSPAAPGWRKLVDQKRYGEAVAAAAAVGFEAECERADAASLISLGDAARFSGQLDKARQAYLTLRRRFPQSATAGDAAFRLGRMDFDQRRAYREAANWFATYLRERPGSGLVREAQGRLMEALHRGGDQTGARRVARDYLATYPGGPHSKLAAALVQGKNLPE
jgi:TolA-binding protein